MSYQGWKNYETWAVHLWLSNEQADYTYWVEQARFLASPEGFEAHRGRFMGILDKEPKRLARSVLAEQLKEELEEAAPDLGATLWADLFGAAMGEVEWAEIADAFLETAAEAVA